MTKNDIIRAIYNSDLTDQDVRDIMAACADAKKVLDVQLFRELQEGDLVTTVAPLKPRYMEHRTGKVVDKFRKGKQGKLVKVDFGEPMGRYGQTVAVPVSSLRRIG